MSNQQINKDGDMVIITTQVEETIDLAAIRDKISELENEPEPTTDDLLAHARAGVVHPYYTPERQAEIEQLKATLERYS